MNYVLIGWDSTTPPVYSPQHSTMLPQKLQHIAHKGQLVESGNLEGEGSRSPRYLAQAAPRQYSFFLFLFHTTCQISGALRDALIDDLLSQARRIHKDWCWNALRKAREKKGQGGVVNLRDIKR